MTGFDTLARALARHAARAAAAHARERRGGDARWRNARLLWPRFTEEDRDGN